MVSVSIKDSYKMACNFTDNLAFLTRSKLKFLPITLYLVVIATTLMPYIKLQKYQKYTTNAFVAATLLTFLIHRNYEKLLFYVHLLITIVLACSNTVYDSSTIQGFCGFVFLATCLLKLDTIIFSSIFIVVLGIAAVFFRRMLPITLMNKVAVTAYILSILSAVCSKSSNYSKIGYEILPASTAVALFSVFLSEVKLKKKIKKEMGESDEESL